MTVFTVDNQSYMEQYSTNRCLLHVYHCGELNHTGSSCFHLSFMYILTAKSLCCEVFRSVSIYDTGFPHISKEKIQGYFKVN